MLWSRRAWLVGAGVAVGAGAGLLCPQPATRSNLRPPGALAEPAFLAACTRCGQCVMACPFGTLHLVSGSGRAVATPTFEPRHIPCYLCRGHPRLACIEVCPTSALSPVAAEQDIRIGTAEIDQGICLAFHGVVCRSCWHACPFPGEAIRFDARLRPIVVASACIGCGLCTHACPTDETAIPIRPRPA